MPKATQSCLAHRLILTVLFLLTAPVFAQPPEPPPQLLAQNIDGYRLRISRAFWGMPQGRNQPQNLIDKALLVDFEAENLLVPFGENINKAVTGIVARGPQGQPITVVRETSESSLLLKGVNPHWSRIFLEFELQTVERDSRLPRGQNRTPLLFTNLMLPAKVNEPVRVGQTQRTPWGTRATLRDIVLKNGNSNEDSLDYVLTFDMETSPESGDLAFNRSRSFFNFLTPDGQATVDIWMYGTLVNNPAQPASRQHQQWEVRVSQSSLLPSERDASLNLRMLLEEYSPGRKKMAHFRQFRFELPLSAVANHVPAAAEPQTVQATSETVHLEAESWKIPGRGLHQLRLWARPADPASPRSWLISSAWLQELRSVLRPIVPLTYWPGRSGWRADGRMAQANENSLDFQLGLPTTNPHSQNQPTRTLNIDLQEVRHAASRFQVSGLSIPRGEAVVRLNRVLPGESNSQLTLLAIGRYQNGRLPVDWPISGNLVLDPKNPITSSLLGNSREGIVIACRWKPEGTTDTVQASHQLNARDNYGRDLLDQPLDFLLPTAPKKWPRNEFYRVIEMENEAMRSFYEFTLLLLPAASDASSFGIDLAIEETILTGKQERLDLVLPK